MTGIKLFLSSLILVGIGAYSSNTFDANVVVVAHSPDLPTDQTATTSDKNDSYRVVPEEFRGVDFKNFKYPFGALTDGDLDERKPRAGGTSYHLDDVFFVDLTGTPEKEAVVIINSVSGGASSDGGSVNVYFIAANQRIIGTINTGSRAYGCSLKSLTIQNKTINIEQFGSCVGRSDKSFPESSCKFCIKDLTSSVYTFQKMKLLRESSQAIESPERNVINYKTEINFSR